jgi:hypothetical protein
MVAQIPVEFRLPGGLVAGAETGRRSLGKPDAPKTPGREDGGDVMLTHVALDGGCQGRVDLKGDFVGEHWRSLPGKGDGVM